MAPSKKKSKQSTTAKRLAEEHRAVNRAVHELEELTARTDATAAFGAWREELASSLRSFRALLSNHFQHEEEGGFLDDVVRKVPSAADSVETLRREHAEINTAVDTLLTDLARTGSGGKADVERFRHAIGDITSTLHHHEISERHLVQRTYYRDYGVGD